MQLYDQQKEPVISASLFPVVDDQCSDDTGDPPAQGKEEDDEERAAPLVDHRKGREEDTDKDTPDTHCRLLFAIIKLRNISQHCPPEDFPAEGSGAVPECLKFSQPCKPAASLEGFTGPFLDSRTYIASFSEQMIRCLQNFQLQVSRVIGMIIQELFNCGPGPGRTVAGEGGRDPASREENIPGSLDLFQHFQ